MEIYCTRPQCPDPVNLLSGSIDDYQERTQQHRFCSACAMPLILSGRFLPLQKLGAGAFGTTFLSIDLHSASRRKCVIKQLRPNSALPADQLEGIKNKFRREAEVLETLGALHAQIPALYAYFEFSVPTFWGSQPNEALNQAGQYFYIAQEYIDGQDLGQEMKHRGKFSEADVIEVMRKLLPVLQFIHHPERGVIHRDIKPGNIMRSLNGQFYLIDFGSVKQVTAGMPIESSIVLGTPIFSPPEQKSQKQVYPSSDLYSLGVTVLCLLSDYSLLGRLYDSTSDRWNWHENIHVSENLGDILDRMLQPQPSQRFQSALEALAVLNPEPIENPTSKPRTGQLNPEPIENPVSKFGTDPIKEIKSKTDQNIFQPVPNIGNNGRTDKLEQFLLESFRQSAFLGSGGWLLAITLISFLGTNLASGFWIVIFGILIIAVFAKRKSNYEKFRLFFVALVSVGTVFFLFPKFLNQGSIQLFSERTLMLAIVASLVFFILVVLLQILEGLRK